MRSTRGSRRCVPHVRGGSFDREAPDSAALALYTSPYEKRPVTARKVTLSVVSRSRAESVRTRFQSTS